MKANYVNAWFLIDDLKTGVHDSSDPIVQRAVDEMDGNFTFPASFMVLTPEGRFVDLLNANVLMTKVSRAREPDAESNLFLAYLNQTRAKMESR